MTRGAEHRGASRIRIFLHFSDSTPRGEMARGGSKTVLRCGKLFPDKTKP